MIFSYFEDVADTAGKDLSSNIRINILKGTNVIDVHSGSIKFINIYV